MRYRDRRRFALIGRPVLLAALCAALSGCSHHSAAPATPTPTAVVSATPTSPPVTSAHPAATLVAYKIATGSDAQSGDANDLAATPIIAPTGTVNTPKFALRQLATGANSPLPPGTRVLGVKIDPTTKLATVNFSHQFKDNFQGGETREAQAIESVLETLGQFPNVQKVQILVVGHKIDSLGGAQELDEPLPTPQSGLTADSARGT